MPRTERRQATRGKTNILTAYRCLENEIVTSMGFGRTLNLSQIGALLEAPDVLTVGQAISLEFLLDEDKLVTVVGHVTRVDKAKAFFHAAVEFDRLDAKTRRLLSLQIGFKPKVQPTARAKTTGKTKPKTKSKPAAKAKPKTKPPTRSRAK